MKTKKQTHRLPGHVKPIRYKISLRPNFEDFTFSGEEKISLVLEKSSKEITLHAAELKITSAKYLHSGQILSGKISYDKKSETATFTFPKNLKEGNGELKLEFRGILNDKMRGFYKSKFQHQGAEKHLATTQFEATDARRAFPCFDEPSQKAIFDVTLMIPSHMSAISNTIESNILEHGSGYKIVEFAPTPKMSTYLLAFIVGEFEYIEAPLRSKISKGQNRTLVRVFTMPGKKEQAKFALDTAVKCMEFYEDYFGIEYPLPTLDMIAIPDFASGAMENWGAVTYRESTLLVEEAVSSTANKQWVAMVIAHELAHQWFGNLVTMEWWTHLWLNEGFASFIEYLAIDHIFPNWHIWKQFVVTEVSDAYSLDSLKNTHPIEVEVKHPSEISEIFDRVSYSKGATILRMLWQYVGDKDFRSGLSHYLKKHAYANAKTEDLWEALEEKSGKPVARVMANWTGKPGHPVINSKLKTQNSKLTLKLTQSRFFSSPISKKQSSNRTVWSIPIKIKNQKSKIKNILMDKKNMQLDISEDWLKLNAGEVSFVRAAYPHVHLKKLEKYLFTGVLSAQDRLGLIRDVFDLAQAGSHATNIALELAASMDRETDFIVWNQLSGHISQIDSLLALEECYEDFRSYGRRLYAFIAQKMTWEKQKNEAHTDSLLRGMVLYKLGSFGDEGVIKKSRALFAKEKNIDPDLRGVVYNIIAQNGGKAEFERLVGAYKTDDNHQEKDRIGRALGQFLDTSLLSKTLAFSLSEHVRYQSALGIISSVWSNAKGRYLAWEFVKDNWRELAKRYAGSHYFTRVFFPAREFTRIADAKDIERFVAKNPLPQAKRTIAQVLEQIYANQAWLARDKKSISAFLTSQKLLK